MCAFSSLVSCMVAISILCWFRTYSSSAFCVRILFVLNCGMFRLFVLIYCPVLSVGDRCGVVWCACLWCLTLKCMGWLVQALSSLVFCLCAVAQCFVDVNFHVFVYCPMFIPLNFMCDQCVCCCCWLAPPALSWNAEATSASALRRTPVYLGVGFP